MLLLLAEQARFLTFGAALLGLPVRHAGLLTFAFAGWAVASAAYVSPRFVIKETRRTQVLSPYLPEATSSREV